MTVDLEHTLQAYGPNGKIARLLFIADRDPTLRIECYMHSLRELLETPNVERYQAIHSKLNAELVTQGLAPMDLNVEYISKTVAENHQKQQRLEQELKSYTSNFIRESIRIGHLELAEFYYSIGDLQNSLKYYSNSREFCTTQSHVLECCLKVVELSLEMDNNQNVSAYLQRGNQALNPNPQGNATSSTSTVHSSLAHRLTLLAGIHCLDNGNYRQCAREFKQLPFTTESMWQFLNPRDVAIYGAICMLATFSRQELKESMENVEFKQYLELEPRIREIMRPFYSCDYKNAFKMLNEFKEELLLDMFMSRHVEKLLQDIKTKAIKQYWVPFSNLSLKQMSEQLDTTIDELQLYLYDLIKSNNLDARIDDHLKILVRSKVDVKYNLYSQTKELAEHLQRQQKYLLLKSKLTKAGIIIKNKDADLKGGRDDYRMRGLEHSTNNPC